ncbi:MAG: class I SAM-dependent methyltransferase [Patescibacteria group bacterium]|nr:class I SAM-dependent methyltransferase [Patescibacteria group bacterium]
MNKIEYQRMASREKNYWWHLGRLRIVETYIKKISNDRKDIKILNVGCGTGGTISLLEKYGRVENVDISDDAIAFMRQNGFKNVSKVTGIELPYNDNEFDIIVALDVLEHIEDDSKALNEWRRVLKPRGNILITVPAYQWLWTSHDTSLQHFRRYTVTSLRSRAAEVRLTAVRQSYAFVFSLPLVVSFRFLNKLLGRKVTEDTSYVDVPNGVNNLFTRFLYLEAILHRFLKFPAGTSVITLLRK